ncbi:MAG: sensor histidine kinase, partial [Armatimonadota bacterium]
MSKSRSIIRLLSVIYAAGILLLFCTVELYLLPKDRETSALVLAILALFLICFLVTFASVIFQNIASRLRSINSFLRHYAQGDLTTNELVPATSGNVIDELAELALLLNQASSVVRQFTRELTREKSKLETILNKADDGFLVIDHEGNVTLANPMALKLLGTDLSQVVGKSVIEATFNYDLSELVKRVIRTNIPASLQVQLVAPEPTYANVYVTPVQPSGAMVVMHDISEAKRVDAMRRDFVANVSHELRTPLASIKAMAETIVLRGKTQPQVAEEFGKRIISEVDRLTAVSDDLLDLAKIEAGHRSLQAEDFYLMEVVQSVMHTLAPNLEQKALELTIDISDGLKVYA